MSLCIPHPPAPIFGRGFITFYEKSEKIMIKEREEGGIERKKKRGRGGEGERRRGRKGKETAIRIEDLCSLEVTQGMRTIPTEPGLAGFTFPWDHFLLGLRF